MMGETQWKLMPGQVCPTAFIRLPSLFPKQTWNHRNDLPIEETSNTLSELKGCVHLMGVNLLL